MSRNLQKKTCCYPKYLNVPSPARAYKVIRAVFFLACVLTCIISPDLTMGILFFLFLFLRRHYLHHVIAAQLRRAAPTREALALSAHVGFPHARRHAAKVRDLAPLHERDDAANAQLHALECAALLLALLVVKVHQL